jgi:prepilin-type N-terminal cleavage/methylation domain-containing protein
MTRAFSMAATDNARLHAEVTATPTGSTVLFQSDEGVDIDVDLLASISHPLTRGVALKRAFSMLELMVVIAIIGVLAGLAMTSASAAVKNAKLHAEAKRFALDVERTRSDAIRQKQYSSFKVFTTPTGSDVQFRSMRYGTAAKAPCQIWHDSLAVPTPNLGIDEWVNYEGIDIAPNVASHSCKLACISEDGLPRSPASNVNATHSFVIKSKSGDVLASVNVEMNGSMTSANDLFDTGISGASFHPDNLMKNDSAPVATKIPDGGRQYEIYGSPMPLPVEMATE